MNRIILIGNGFDLAHGLKTRYKDFIDWLLEKEKRYFENKDNYCLCQNKPKYEFRTLRTGKQGQNYYFAYDDFIANNIEISQYENTKIPLSVDFNANNIVNKFLLQLKLKLYIQKWVDVENEYYNALKSIVDNNFILPNNIHYPALNVDNIINSIKGNLPNNNKSTYSIDYLNDCFNKIKLELERYLTTTIDEPIRKIARLENFIFSKFDFVDFTKQGVDNLIDLAYQKILFLKEKDDKQKLSMLDASESTLGVYDLIKALVSKEKPNIHESFVCSLDTRADFVKLLEKHNDRIEISSLLLPENVLFLNFNYTNTESKYSVDNFFARKEEGYKREFRINQETIHIHGELNNNENPIIFGYGDELDDDYNQILKENDNKLLENVKSIKYGETYNYKKLLKFVESDNFQVFIMGHSCGNSDRTLLNTLFEHENCQSIKIFYHEEFNEKREKIRDDFSDIYRNITRNFKKFADLRAKVVDKTNSTPLPQYKKTN